MTTAIAIAAAALLALRAAAAVAGEEGQGPAATTGVEVHGTALRVRLADGRTLGPHDRKRPLSLAITHIFDQPQGPL